MHWAATLHETLNLGMMPVVAQGKGGGEGGVRTLVEQKGLMQISDPGALMAIVDSVLAGELESRSCHVSEILVATAQVFLSAECSPMPPGMRTANPAQLEQYRGGKTKLQGYFVG